tara:strand:- start:293 stop:2509 length:2217 start_codon:yes stop_codon:yes gene_type:complete
MATEFISNSWLMPENSNQDRVSNYSLSFDGSSQYIDLTEQNYSGAFSMSFWVNPIEFTSNNRAFLVSDDSNSNFIWLLANNDIRLKINGTQHIFTESGGNDIVPSTWQNIIITRDGSNNVNCFRNSSAFGSSGSISGTFDINKIARAFSGHWMYEGKITEISIFDYALTDGTGGTTNQIGELYGTGSAVGNPMAITNGRKPVAYHPLGNSAFNGEFLASNGALQDYVFNFDGLNDIIEAPRLNLTSAICVSFWIKTTATGVQWIVNEDRTSGTNRNWAILLASNKLNFLVYHTDGTNTQFIRSTASEVQDGNWHNVIFTWDGTTTANAFKTFIDGGNEESTTATSSGIRNLSTFGLAIGSVQQNAGFRFDGQLSNVAIFNTSLPATGTESVESLYNYGTPPNIASYSGLQGWYELDASATFDGSNWSIPDASSNSNTGTSNGMTAANLVQSDLIINAPFDSFSLDFDGSNDYIDSGSFSALNSGTAMTISLWFKGSNYITNARLISCGQFEIYQSIATASNTQGRFYYKPRKNFGNPIVTLGGTSASGVGNLVDGNWHHICLTFDNSTTTAIVYEDGVPVITNTSASGTLNSASSNLYIGSSSASSNFIDGSISNISIYNSELTLAQVTTLYNEGKPFDLNTFAVTPVAWWRLGSVNSSYNSTTSEWTILDEIGTNNGTGSNLGPAQTALVDGVGATGNGTSSGMSSGTNKSGDAPYSNSNAVSYNMSVTAKSTSVPT